MKRSVRVLALLFVLAFSASQVFAAQPTIQYLDIPQGFTITVTGFCSFPVKEVALANKEKLVTFFNSAGQVTFQIYTGVNKWEFTNVNTGKTIDLNASGPATFTLESGTDLVLSEGGGVSFYYIPNPPSGIPSFALTKGRVIAELDPTTFNVTNVVSVNGTVQDICALLQ